MWADCHTPEELLQLVPQLRLAWVEPQDLKSQFKSGVLEPICREAALLTILEDALEHQVQYSKKRKRDADDDAPNEYMCPITCEVAAQSLVVTDIGCLGAAANARPGDGSRWTHIRAECNSEVRMLNWHCAR